VNCVMVQWVVNTEGARSVVVQWVVSTEGARSMVVQWVVSTEGARSDAPCKQNRQDVGSTSDRSELPPSTQPTHHNCISLHFKVVSILQMFLQHSNRIFLFKDFTPSF
jgi:hypothetical protein